ncbi:MAG: hypothetical protein QOC56_350 [Alphaproteobacteria bacterium]|nr:hypothetical protein [Alphaproteobacteria bacterium]
MAADGLPVERLREYLRELPKGARALLIAELERAASRGEDIPGGDALLQEVRRLMRDPGEPAPRFGNPAELFFRPIEPFLVDDDPAHKQQARIARAALEPLWAWIVRDLAPDEAKTYSEAIGHALASDGGATGEQETQRFQDQVVVRLQAALAAVKTDDKARRRLAGQIGTPKALDDVQDLLRILSSRDALALIADRLPIDVRNFADVPLENVKALLDSPLAGHRDLLPYVLVLVMGRLAAPWQLVRLAIKAAESDDAARIAATPYAVAVTMTLFEIERMVGALKAALKRGAAAAAASLLKAIHDAARGLRTELDLAGNANWAHQLAAIRSEIATVLKAEIEPLPARVRRLLRPRPSSEILRGSTLDPDEVAETEAMIELAGACRNYASELAINEVMLRTYHDLQQYLDTGKQPLLDGLRHAGEADRRFRQSQVEAAVRFCGKVFGKEYASLLAKAAEVAINSERKAAAKA